MIKKSYHMILFSLLLISFAGFCSCINELIQNIMTVKSNNTASPEHPFLEAINSIFFDHKLERIKGKCDQNGGENAYQQLEESTESLKHCLESIPFNEQIELPSKICPEKVIKMKNCFDLHKNKINVCEEKEEKFLTDYLSNTIVSMMQFGCQNLLKLLNELTKNSDGFDCLAYLIQEKNKSVKKNLISCMKNVQYKEENVPYFTHERYCKRIIDSKNCVLDLNKKLCKDNKAMENFIKGLGEAAKFPCVNGGY